MIANAALRRHGRDMLRRTFHYWPHCMLMSHQRRSLAIFCFSFSNTCFAFVFFSVLLFCWRLKPNCSSNRLWNEIHRRMNRNSRSQKWRYWPEYGSKPNKRWKWQTIAVYSCPILMHRSGPHSCTLAKYKHASRACENGVGVKPNGCYHAVWQTSSSQSPRNAMDGTQVPIIAQTSGNGTLFHQSLNLLQKQVHASLDTHKHTHTHTNLNCTSSSDSSPALLVMSTLAFLHTTLLNLRPTPCNT